MTTVLPRTLPVIRLSVAAMQAALFMTFVVIAAPVFAQAPAAPVNLRAQPGDGEVILTWDDPNDPSLTGYEFRVRVTNEQPERWRPDWTFIVVSGKESDATTTHVRVYQLANGTSFIFGIRAVRGNVKGDAAHVTATPRAPSPPRPPSTGGGGSSGSSRDDHGDTPAQATSVSLGEAAPWSSSTTGQINTSRDIDYFELTLPHDGVLEVWTTGSTGTMGTVWQDGEELATVDVGDFGLRNFRLSTRVKAGSVVVAVEGNRTGAYTLKARLRVGYLENPGPASFQSGIGVISGWVCDADAVKIKVVSDDELGQGEFVFGNDLFGSSEKVAGYGTERLDTGPVCSATDNGFGLLFNWNRLGDGEYTVIAWVDGVELGRAPVTVTTLGEEFLEDVAGECMVKNFPMDGETVRLVWQQTNQNFAIAGESAPNGDNAARSGALEGYLENPGPNSFQSGLGVISGWVCEAETVEIEIEKESGETERQVAAYGTERVDTAESCGDTDNGFGLLFNWNRLGDGEHTVVAWVDGVELGRARVQVTTLGEEFLEDVAGECVVENFPLDGETVRLVWQQGLQNFMLAPPGP